MRKVIDHTSNDIATGTKAAPGEITRKFIDTGTGPTSPIKSTTIKAGSGYVVPMAECKSWVELEDGSRLTEEDYEAIECSLLLTKTILDLAKLQIDD
ncbi:hypothetical protein KI809_04345 [Geobacter pelophilus]|uniref:Uncharacterized protein n=1 Tax=Geoanaerobacter pelophilus TaxID=60036 RepID=A0AAW4KY15_9BACT|nr:hypothetical protein [Geoanaerobacter pelophilus]MBT0663526.1 hypothetical protein [Geoanaerobacter pelophilus]